MRAGGTSRAAIHGGSTGLEHAAEGPLLFAPERDQIAVLEVPDFYWRSPEPGGLR